MVIQSKQHISADLTKKMGLRADQQALEFAADSIGREVAKLIKDGSLKVEVERFTDPFKNGTQLVVRVDVSPLHSNYVYDLPLYDAVEDRLRDYSGMAQRTLSENEAMLEKYKSSITIPISSKFRTNE